MKKKSEIYPGDLVCDFDPALQKGPVALVISVEHTLKRETQVHFMVLGEEFLYDGVTKNEKYYLISRLS